MRTKTNDTTATTFEIVKNGPREYAKESRVVNRIYTGMITTWDVVNTATCELVSEHRTRREAREALALINAKHVAGQPVAADKPKRKRAAKPQPADVDFGRAATAKRIAAAAWQQQPAQPLKITRELRKEINAAVRKNVGGANPLAEVGLRGADRWLPNALNWHDGVDLGDMTRLATLREIDADPKNPGCFELDLYVTSGIGMNRELETNVCILIRDGHVVGAESNGLRVPALKQRLGFPFGGFDDQQPLTPEGEPLACRATTSEPDTADDDPRELAEDYPGQLIDGPDDADTRTDAELPMRRDDVGGSPDPCGDIETVRVLTLDEKVAIERDRQSRTSDAWQLLPVIACSGVGCDQKFKREHDVQLICRDCMTYEPGTFTFYPIGDERAPWHAQTQPKPPTVDAPKPAAPPSRYAARARELMLVPDAARRFCALLDSALTQCPDCGERLADRYESTICTHARLCQNSFAADGGAL